MPFPVNKFRTKIFNNTIISSGGRNIYFVHNKNVNAYTLITNNIIYGNGSGVGIEEGSSNNSPSYLENNSLYNLSNLYYDYETSSYKNTISAVNGLLDITYNYNNISSNPLFVNEGNSDYHIQSTSPCKDSGKDVNSSLYSLINYDYDYQSRPYNSTYDIGADEYMP